MTDEYKPITLVDLLVRIADALETIAENTSPRQEEDGFVTGSGTAHRVLELDGFWRACNCEIGEDHVSRGTGTFA